MADEIRHDDAAVIAQVQITLVALPNGTTQTDIRCSGAGFTEIHARFLLDKARAFLDDHWRAANMPRIAPATNGQPINLRRLIG